MGSLPKITLVLCGQALSEVFMLWAGHAIMIPLKVRARHLWLSWRSRADDIDDPMTIAELEGDLLKQELVLETFMYDVRNSAEYLAHPCVAVGLYLMGADPRKMLLAW